MRTIATLILLTITVGCSGSPSTGFDVCAAVDDDLVESLIGSTSTERFAVERYSECRWEAVEGTQAITAGVETAADPELYLRHSIEGTTSGSVSRLDVGEEAVLFEGEALMARSGTYVVVVTAEGAELDRLPPVLSAVVRSLPEAPTAE